MTANLDLTKAKQVTSASHAQAANELIAKGWTLIATASGKDETEYPIVIYSFAWFHEEPPR